MELVIQMNHAIGDMVIHKAIPPQLRHAAPRFMILSQQIEITQGGMDVTYIARMLDPGGGIGETVRLWQTEVQALPGPADPDSSKLRRILGCPDAASSPPSMEEKGLLQRRGSC